MARLTALCGEARVGCPRPVAGWDDDAFVSEPSGQPNTRATAERVCYYLLPFCTDSVILDSVLRLTPKRMVLDLLRVSPEALPVSVLVSTGELFGFPSGTTRVAITRLLGRGLVESDERGSYRLAPAAEPVSRLVDDWRSGDARMRPWDGQWLGALFPRGILRTARAHALKAMRLFSLREGLGGLWVRPHNLAANLDEVRASLGGLGLPPTVEIFVVANPSESLGSRWCRDLWPASALRQSYRNTLDRLTRSHTRLKGIPLQRAMVESYREGGEAIRVLALDPLLPDAIVDGADRRRLWQAMLDYEMTGIEIWDRFQDHLLKNRAGHLTLVSGA